MRRSAVHSSLCILLAPGFDLATIRLAIIASSMQESMHLMLGKHYLNLWAMSIYARNIASA